MLVFWTPIQTLIKMRYDAVDS